MRAWLLGFFAMFGCRDTPAVTGKVEQYAAQVVSDAVEPVSDAQPRAPKPKRQVREWTRGSYSRELSAAERTSGAMARKGPEVEQMFADGGVQFPPRQLLLIVYKQERELDVWASDAPRGPLTHIATYSICAASGTLGPKRREGDRQVPEGIYTIDSFNPRSRFHLALHVDYPNGRDRAQGSTGSAIMIHGGCASIGCVALGDERIEELWLMAKALRGGRPQLWSFPGRDIASVIADGASSSMGRFWRGLLEIQQAFAANHELPPVRWDADGVYHVRR